MTTKTLTKRNISFLLAFLFILGPLEYANPRDIRGEAVPLVFSTWEGFEIDKCASIWLIKRFIETDAGIKFFPKGMRIKEGIPFDTPDAKFRRYHNMSTFESLLRHYGLQDKGLIHIGKIIHDIEVNIWEKKVFDETLIVQDSVNKIIMSSKNNAAVIEGSCEFFDSLFKEITLR